jgi:predicted Rossmann-fold nucleotide-binding protein
MRQQASRFKRMCVFCGSSQGNKTSYRDAAIDLAKELVRVPFLHSQFACGS